MIGVIFLREETEGVRYNLVETDKIFSINTSFDVLFVTCNVHGVEGDFRGDGIKCTKIKKEGNYNN